MLSLLLHTQAASAIKGVALGIASQQQHIYYADPEHDRRFVTEYTESVVREIMRAAAVPAVWITSTVRDEHDQARAMLNNLKAERALVAQRNAATDPEKRAALDERIRKEHVGYAKAGSQVLATANKALNHGDADDAVIEQMIATIQSVGLTRVTKHAAASGRNTVDISASRIRKDHGKTAHAAFIEQVKAAVSGGKVARFGWAGGPKGNGKLFHDGACFHLEIEQPSQ